MRAGVVERDRLFGSLPDPWPQPLLAEIRRRVAASSERFVVLDDDPTGGQTLHGMPVLAAWDDETLLAEVERSPAFFLLTNSRAVSEDEAVALAGRIGSQLRRVEEQSGRRIVAGSRGDSTLRGHFPAETNALYRAMTGEARARPTCLFVPYFGEGGRFTIDDTQYVLQGSELVPVAETEFARDPAFAFEHSHLPSWLGAAASRLDEKAGVASISIDELRRGGPDAVASRLRNAAAGATLIVNAACDRDLEVLVMALLDVEAEGRRFLYRTAASFVRVRAGIESRPLITAAELALQEGGGLVVAGSHADRTNRQLERLLEAGAVRGVELGVEALFGAGREDATACAAAGVEAALRSGADAVLFTSRARFSDAGGADPHDTGRGIASALCDVLARLQSRPAFLVVKGGSTAYAVATAGLGVKRAEVLGQLLPGVPVWRLGEEARYAGLPYVIFPGNVGSPDALMQAMGVLRGGAHAGPG